MSDVNVAEMLREALEEALSDEYGTFVDANTPSRIARDITDALLNLLAAASLLRQDPPQVAGEDVERVARAEAFARWPVVTDRDVWELTTRPVARAAFIEGAKFAALSARPVQAQEGLPCDGGCNDLSGPMEDCSRHGRPVREVWEALATVQAREAAALARAEALRAGIEAEMARLVVSHRTAVLGGALPEPGRSRVLAEDDVYRRLRALLDGDSEGREARQAVAQEGEEDPTCHCPTPWRRHNRTLHSPAVETGGEGR